MMRLKMGSARLRRVVCGVSPQTPSQHFSEPNGEAMWWVRSRRRKPKTKRPLSTHRCNSDGNALIFLFLTFYEKVNSGGDQPYRNHDPINSVVFRRAFRHCPDGANKHYDADDNQASAASFIRGLFGLLGFLRGFGRRFFLDLRSLLSLDPLRLKVNARACSIL